jgi:hypothetical protein
MTRYLLAGVAALGMMTSATMAQTSTSTSTTTTVAPSFPAPVIAGTSEVGVTAGGDGRITLLNGSVSKDSSGKTVEVTNTSTSYPLTDMITRTKKIVEINNGVATETVTTSQSYPPSPQHPGGVPPVETTTTRTYVVSAR